MLKGKQKKLDKNKDGKISGDDFKMMKAKSGKMAKKKSVNATAGAGSVFIQLKTLKGLLGLKKGGGAKYGKMMKANKGMEAKSTKGYGAARTSGMGLQDESLKSGQNYEITKGGDYIKDLI